MTPFNQRKMSRRVSAEQRTILLAIARCKLKALVPENVHTRAEAEALVGGMDAFPLTERGGTALAALGISPEHAA